MLHKIKAGTCSLLLLSLLAGALVGAFSINNLHAQDPRQYPMVYDGGDGTTGSGGGGGSWRCPIASIGSEGIGGGGTCTSVGCKPSCTGCSNPFIVCAFRASDTTTKCPPLEQCEQN